MIRGGLVSISFRKLSAREVVELVARAGLQGIEWGGDVHVPHGDAATAREVAAMTRDAGLTVAAYGSYYRAGEPATGDNPDFAAVLNSAVRLGAPTIRVWSGRRPSAAADNAYRGLVLADLRRIGALAAAHSIVVSCEHHSHTLTDSPASARELYAALQGSNVDAYWQPTPELSTGDNAASLKDLLPRLVNLHVFHWAVANGRRDRCPLAAGRPDWDRYLRLAASTGRDHWALLEFVKDDRPEQFVEDAGALRSWLAGIVPQTAAVSPGPKAGR
jgi:3-dehydroshikimate dehydratase